MASFAAKLEGLPSLGGHEPVEAPVWAAFFGAPKRKVSRGGPSLW